jgi:hypothetical protein
MKKSVKLFSMLIFCFVLTTGFTSCSDDGYSLDKYWRSMVTVNKVGENTYDFTLDSGEKLWVAAPVGLNLKPKYDRAIINYTILSENFQGYDYAVKLNGFTDVLTKDIAYIASDDQVKQDSIGHDPIKVYTAWAGGGYLNIYFGFNTGETKAHMINLVSAEENLSVSDDVVKLQFRHNKLDDPEHYPVNGYVSFDLAPYMTSGRDKVAFDIEWTDFSGETKTKTIEYKYGEAETAGSTTLSENDISTNLNIY